MKATFLTLAFAFFLFNADCIANEIKVTEKGKLEITVSYERQSGRGSNQYAIWIENAQGQLVKTLFVTKFTAEGGYSFRPDCTPMWVNKANPASMSEPEVDAFTGATPQTGNHTYIWNLTDNKGNQVSKGNYTFYVQGTLLGKNQVLFKGVISVGDKKVSVNPQAEFSSDDTQNKGMITAVKATYFP